jgi:hypothetical protein
MRNRASMALEIEKHHQFLVTALFREAHCQRGRRCCETSANSTKRIVEALKPKPNAVSAIRTPRQGWARRSLDMAEASHIGPSAC